MGTNKNDLVYFQVQVFFLCANFMNDIYEGHGQKNQFIIHVF